MGSVTSYHRKKIKLQGKSDSKTDQPVLISLTTVTEKAAINESTDNKKKDLESGMDAKGDSCNNNNNSSAANKLEADTINQDGEVCNQLTNTADNMDNSHENKSRGQCNDSCFDITVNPTSPADSTCNNVNTNSGNKCEDTNAETNETTQSNSNEVNIKHSSEVKTGHDSVSKSGQICDKVDDPPSNDGVESTNQEVTVSPGGGANTAEIDTKETSENSDKENTLNNIEQSNSDNVSTVSSSDATRNNSAQEPPSPPNSNESTENTETSTDEATGKPTNEKDKNDSAASNTGGNKQTESEYRLNENLQFYRNELYSKPFPGAKIEEMLEWKGDYQKLERTHSYIQWLFPIPESRGMNYSAQPLQEHEAQAISEDESLRDKVLEAFKMMLDFYGMELELEPLTFKRGDNWEERYEHLNRSIHNHFRITRIIKALGELGWQHLQKPWLEFMIHEATINQVLPKLNKDSTMCHFIDGLKDVEDQGKVYHLIADLNDQLNKNTADVSKNDGKDASDRSDKTDERSEDTNSSDDKGKGLTESTKENSIKGGKEEKPNEEKEKIDPVVSEADANDNKNEENSDSKGSDIKEAKNIDGDGEKNDSNEKANPTSADGNESGEDNGTHDGAESRGLNKAGDSLPKINKEEDVVSDSQCDQEENKANQCGPENDKKYADSKSNRTLADTDQKGEVGEVTGKCNKDKKDTEDAKQKEVDENSIENVCKSSIADTKDKITDD